MVRGPRPHPGKGEQSGTLLGGVVPGGEAQLPGGDGARGPEHRAHLAELHREGTLLLSGPLDDGSTALLVLVADSAEDALARLDGDPFKRERVIVDRVAREWKVVNGELPGA